MSTRSNIIRQNLDNTYDVIYCHWDGYPSHNGKILYEHYQDISKINALIALGDLSILEKDIGTQHDFEDRTVIDQCTFYARDRGDKDTQADHYNTYDALCAMLEKAWTEWLYIYRMSDNKWYYTNNPSPTWFKLCDNEQMQTTLLTPKAWEEES